MDTNRLFCFWLQGYFEISGKNTLDQDKIQTIQNTLDTVKEPLGTFTGWLYDVCLFCKQMDYAIATCHYFAPLIENRLNSVFFHAIDNTFDTMIPKEQLLKIHNGEIA